MWRIVKSWQLWRNFLFLHMTDVNEIYPVLLQNQLVSGLNCFTVKSVLSRFTSILCEEKLLPKMCHVEKKWQIWCMGMSSVSPVLSRFCKCIASSKTLIDDLWAGTPALGKVVQKLQILTGQCHFLILINILLSGEAPIFLSQCWCFQTWYMDNNIPD